MKLNIRNKRGEATGSGIMSMPFILMIILIVGGIYGGLIIFFGNGYDYRQTETQTLLNNVKNCFFKEKFDLNSLNEKDLFEKCAISSKVIDDGEHMIYIKDKNGKEFVLGVADFKIRCGLVSRYKNKDLPLCIEYKSNDYTILVGSSQNSRRIIS